MRIEFADGDVFQGVPPFPHEALTLTCIWLPVPRRVPAGGSAALSRADDRNRSGLLKKSPLQVIDALKTQSTSSLRTPPDDALCGVRKAKSQSSVVGLQSSEKPSSDRRSPATDG